MFIVNILEVLFAIYSIKWEEEKNEIVRGISEKDWEYN